VLSLYGGGAARSVDWRQSSGDWQTARVCEQDVVCAQMCGGWRPMIEERGVLVLLANIPERRVNIPWNGRLYVMPQPSRGGDCHTLVCSS